MRGLGWKQDTHDARDFSAQRLAASPRKFTTPCFRAFRKQRLYQGSASSCVAQALTRVIHIRSLMTDKAAPISSPLYTYLVGRRQEYAGANPASIPPLDDSGMFPRLAMQATRAMGIVRWDDAPYDATKVLDDLDPALCLSAYDQRGMEYYRIDGNRSDQVRDAMLRGFPCLFGMQVDKAFEDWDGSAPIASINGNELLGGHMLAPIEVLPNGDILFDNWWDSWGIDDGLGILSKGLFESDWVGDVYAVKSVPLFGGPR